MSQASRRTLNHLDAAGRVRMVDVGGKAITEREATAEAFVRVSAAARRLASHGDAKKGSPLEVARIAGIQAAKRTADLIPLCHPLALSHVSVDVHPARGGYRIVATVRVAGRTGVEMEALTAVTVASLTVYDMLKAVDKSMVIEGVRLLTKRGGRSGPYRAAKGSRQ
jgi:cyclic pyranopterin monophosphate synthase